MLTFSFYVGFLIQQSLNKFVYSNISPKDLSLVCSKITKPIGKYCFNCYRHTEPMSEFTLKERCVIFSGTLPGAAAEGDILTWNHPCHLSHGPILLGIYRENKESNWIWHHREVSAKTLSRIIGAGSTNFSGSQCVVAYENLTWFAESCDTVNSEYALCQRRTINKCKNWNYTVKCNMIDRHCSKERFDISHQEDNMKTERYDKIDRTLIPCNITECATVDKKNIEPEAKRKVQWWKTAILVGIGISIILLSVFDGVWWYHYCHKYKRKKIKEQRKALKY